MDKSGWGRGPWDDEPDKIQWADVETGMPCLAVRNSWGVWCGYVGVTAEHPLYACCYDDVESNDLTAHGGLTFSDFCAIDDKDHGICHIPDPGESDDMWWFGFDCAHCYDYMPGYQFKRSTDGDLKYRTIEYVKAECADLARQLHMRSENP